MQETWVQSLGWEDPLEEVMTTYSSILYYYYYFKKNLFKIIELLYRILLFSVKHQHESAIGTHMSPHS